MHDQTPEELATKLYLKGEYIARNPSLHEEDSSWKVAKLAPFLDEFASRSERREVEILDVGGGAGSVLDGVATYLSERHRLRVGRHALDLSAPMLEVQRRRSPSLKSARHEDIRRTSIGDKEIDLTLMIDVLEHVPTPEAALAEVRRISRFAIYKVPLENNLFLRALDLLKGGRARADVLRTVGHVNRYDARGLRRQVRPVGKVVRFGYTGVYDYYLHDPGKRAGLAPRDVWINRVGAALSHVSPALAARVAPDFAIVLVESA